VGLGQKALVLRLGVVPTAMKRLCRKGRCLAAPDKPARPARQPGSRGSRPCRRPCTSCRWAGGTAGCPHPRQPPARPSRSPQGWGNGAQHSRRASNRGVWAIPNPCIPPQVPGPTAVHRESVGPQGPPRHRASVSPPAHQDQRPHSVLLSSSRSGE